MNRILSVMVGLVICVVVIGVYLNHRTQQRTADHVVMLAEQQKNAERYAAEKAQREQAAVIARIQQAAAGETARPASTEEASQAASFDRSASSSGNQHVDQSLQLMQRMGDSYQRQANEIQEYTTALMKFQSIASAWSDTNDPDELQTIAQRINAVSVPACLQSAKNRLSEQIVAEANGADSDLSKTAFSFFLEEERRCVRSVRRPAGSV